MLRGGAPRSPSRFPAPALPDRAVAGLLFVLASTAFFAVVDTVVRRGAVPLLHALQAVQAAACLAALLAIRRAESERAVLWVAAAAATGIAWTLAAAGVATGDAVTPALLLALLVLAAAALLPWAPGAQAVLATAAVAAGAWNALTVTPPAGVSPAITMAALVLAAAASIFVSRENHRTRAAAEAAWARLRDAEQRLRLAIESVPAVLFAIDRNGRFTLSEGRGLAALGLKPGEAVGRSAFEMYAHIPEIGPHLRAALAGEPQHGRVKVGGTVFDVRYVPIRRADGAVEGVMGLAVDVTEAERRETALQEAHRAAVEADAVKTRFLAAVSHEIRNPLNPVVAFAEMLAASPLSPEQRGWAEAIREGAQRALALVGDILEYTRLESEPFEQRQEWSDVAALVEGVARLHAPAAHRKGLRLIAAAGPSAAGQARGDARRWAQILSNLVTNAVRYTGGGHVLLAASAAPAETGMDGLVFDVADTGPGIPPESREEVFRPFRQLERGGPRGEGAGLGLSIVAELVRRLEGTIELRSSSAGGAWFRIALPARRRPAHPPSTGAVEGARVLLYEPDRCAALAAQALLAQLGVQSLACTAPSRLAHLAHNGTFHAVVAWAGADATAWRRVAAVLPPALPALWMVPLGIDVPVSGPTVGVPLERRELRAALERVLGPTSREEAAPRQQERGHPLRGVRVLAVDDNPVNLRVLAAIATRLGCTVDCAADGAEAVRRAGETSYDCVLMDLSMPGMDGITAARAIRAAERSTNAPRVPIIAVTASATEADHEQCREAGFDDHLAKPVTPESVRAALQRWTCRNTARSRTGAG